MNFRSTKPSLRKNARKSRIELTYVLPKKGRVILKRDRADFDRQIARLEQILKKYQDALKTSVDTVREDFKNQMLEEFKGRWKSRPAKFPEHVDAGGTRSRQDQGGGFLAVQMLYSPGS